MQFAKSLYFLYKTAKKIQSQNATVKEMYICLLRLDEYLLLLRKNNC